MKVLMLFAVLVLVSACTAPRTPNVRRVTGSETSYLVTDARQRIVPSTSLGPYSRPGLADPIEIVCSEPSPDVASAVATSFSGALSVLGKGSGSLSGSQIESLSQLVERTATIQLLRDKMYQSCLAYANGAVSGTTYSMIMAQLDRTIVSLLLGENAAAAFGRSGGAIGTQSGTSGSASLTGPGGEQQLEKSVDAVADAQAELDKAKKDYDAVAKAKGADCALEKASATGAGDACKAITDEDRKVAVAENRLNATLRVLQTAAVVQTSAHGETSKVTGVGGLDRTASPELARELRLMQLNFLEQDTNDLFLPTCMVELGLHNQQGSTAGQILDKLVAIIQVARETEVRASGDARAASDEYSRSPSKDTKAKLDDAQSNYADAQAKSREANDDLKNFLRDPTALADALKARGAEDPHPLVFQEIVNRWREGKTALGAETAPAEIELVSGAANLNRRSQLAATCIEELPAHLIYTRKFSEKYRIARLNAQVQIEAAAAGNRDTTERARLLEQFQGALKACKEVDDKQKAGCQAAVQQVFAPTTPPKAN